MAKQSEPLSKPLLETWRADLAARGLAISSINQRLSAVRLLFRQAAERGALPADEAARLASVENLKQQGQRLGKWLTEKEAGRLLGVPDAKTKIGLRDRAILALLGCLRAAPRRTGPLGGESPAAARRALGVAGFFGEGKTAANGCRAALGEANARCLA